jgi:hypothetical protein
MPKYYLISLENPIRKLLRFIKREFKEDNIKEFQYLLQKETWQGIFLEPEVDAKFKSCMDTFLCYFDMVFPLKLVNSRKPPRNSWITRRLRISSKKDATLY